MFRGAVSLLRLVGQYRDFSVETEVPKVYAKSLKNTFSIVDHWPLGSSAYFAGTSHAIVSGLELFVFWGQLRDLVQIRCSWQIEHNLICDLGQWLVERLQIVRLHQ